MSTIEGYQRAFALPQSRRWTLDGIKGERVMEGACVDSWVMVATGA